MIKDVWSVNKKYFEEDQNMNKALAERFLELMPAAVLPACYGGANAATSYPETGRA